MLHTFKIHAPIDSDKAFVEMDGKHIEGVTDVRFSLRGGGKATKIELTIWGEVEIAGEFHQSEILNIKRDATGGEGG